VTLEEYVAAAQGTKSFEELLRKLERNKVVNITTGGISQRLGMGVFSSLRKETKDSPLRSQELARSAENFSRPGPSKIPNTFTFYPGMETSKKWSGNFLPYENQLSVPQDQLRVSQDEDAMFRSVIQENERKSKLSKDMSQSSYSEPASRRQSMVTPEGESKSVPDDESRVSAESSEPPESALRKLLIEDSELFKTPSEAQWESKNMDEWTSDDVHDFILSRAGKSECWDYYATKMKESQVDGKTLSVYESVNELVEDGYGLKKHHARVLLRAITDFKQQR